ncbi:LutB/LldF family L-lactate oxidation iron-sulfur protein [Taibaiella soli]|uniref:Iron-sulfur cluster-binding protein n=1 Tax=Taibaiella soli TaxID=1649169 RepID=A0A2W2AC00_9BACT|nr:LutB/LldF family L-lactate oxidation iron-sulfur protein [Taibaiella soli]PZF72945.1 iron-sulfur cluster-binding protein [Taibaiella soli]
MTDNRTNFLAKSEVKAQDLEHKRKVAFNIDKYNAAVINGKKQFADLELARKKAKNAKWKAIENLDQYLEQFEQNFTARGGKLIWAENANDALDAILAICKEKNTHQVVKSKSMVTEEIHLNKFLEKNGIESVETDLGEYIQQLDGEPPYHIVTPAMHKSKEDVAKLFHEKLGTDPNLAPTELTLIAREKLRQKYLTAEVGITGGNFLLADIGGVCVTENEGNGRLSTSFPKTHIAIVGIEKILPSVNDLPLFWPLLATYGTGQQLTAYNTIFTGPRQPGETDGPDEMYVILLDNGRTNMLQHPEMREGMYCIRCGSCLNACPVYKNIGGHAYGTTYSGPIGSVITPHLQGIDEYKHLSYASTLCGNCTEVCPVKINIHGMLLENRHTATKEGMNGFSENIGWKLWRKGMMSRTMMNAAGPGFKNMMLNKVFGETWLNRRSGTHFAEKSFNKLWKERK